MGYGSGAAPARRGGGSLIFLIVIAVGAYLLFSGRGGVPSGIDTNDANGRPRVEQENNELNHDQAESSQEPFGGGGGDFEPRPMPSTGRSGRAADWDIEDVELNGGNQKTAGKVNSSPSSESSDWSIEDAKATNNENQFQFSTSPTADDAPAPPSGGDWSIEDAGKEKLKKTEKGDWSIED